MTRPDASTRPPTIREIAELTSWARALCEKGPGADPAEQAAYLAAKTDLLARLTHSDQERS
jgi:hypothetical protein